MEPDKPMQTEEDGGKRTETKMEAGSRGRQVCPKGGPTQRKIRKHTLNMGNKVF